MPSRQINYFFSKKGTGKNDIVVRPGSDGHGPAPSLEGALVGLVEGLVDVDHGVDDGVAVVGGHALLVGDSHREEVWCHP